MIFPSKIVDVHNGTIDEFITRASTAIEAQVIEIYFKTRDLQVAIIQANHDRDLDPKSVASQVKTYRQVEPMATILADIDALGTHDTCVALEKVDLVNIVKDLPLEQLNEEERTFIINYTGDVKTALAAAGLKNTTKNKLRLYSSQEFCECKQTIDTLLAKILLPDALAIQTKAWNIASDDNVQPAVQLQALKLLAQMQGELRAESGNGTAVNVQINTHIE